MADANLRFASPRRAKRSGMEINMENWFVINKRADFAGIAQKFGISPVTARLLRNRDIIGDEAIRRYLYGGIHELYSPHLLKDADLLAEILLRKIREKKRIRIIGDYDIDGVMSTYILYRGMKACGGEADFQIPDRMKDGYGINDHLIENAHSAGIDTIVTCDNGIAAIDEIAHAKAYGMTVLVTDHHEIPYTEENGERHYIKSAADAVVNPKQPDCPYPYKGLCGAAVAFKVIQVLYEKTGASPEAAYEFLENVAFATVGDVMDLTDENRILVKEGLKRIRCTANPGMRALILQNGLLPEQVTAYHFGFVLGPCVNASGRLETARLALQLFLQEDTVKAAELAAKLVELNAQRKDMTAEGVKLAAEAVEEGGAGEKVLVIYLPEVHESLAGIIAGRIRELYHRPVFVLTRSEDGVKGSGRSVECYSMYDELCKCREFFTKFGGHPMAAGLTMPADKIEEFRQRINRYAAALPGGVPAPVLTLDCKLKPGGLNVEMVQSLAWMEPFGTGNPEPLFGLFGMKLEEIARATDANLNTVKSRLYKALRKLRDMTGEDLRDE